MKAIIIVALLGFSSISNSYIVYGAGNKSCEQWVLETNKDMTYVSLMMKSWVSGFITSYVFNMEVLMKSREMLEVNLESIDRRITEYCKAKPDAKLSDAAIFVAIGLRGKIIQ